MSAWDDARPWLFVDGAVTIRYRSRAVAERARERNGSGNVVPDLDLFERRVADAFAEYRAATDPEVARRAGARYRRAKRALADAR